MFWYFSLQCPLIDLIAYVRMTCIRLVFYGGYCFEGVFMLKPVLHPSGIYHQWQTFS